MATWYVTQSGAGAEDGTSAGDAWAVADIDWTGSGVQPGDELVLSDDITSRIIIGGSGTSGNQILIRDGAIDVGGLVGQCVENNLGAAEYFTLANIDGADATASIFDLGQSTENPRGIRVLDCSVSGPAPIGLNTTGVGVLIDNFTVGSGVLDGDCINFSAGGAGTTSGIIQNCYLVTKATVSADCIQISTGVNGDVQIQNCYLVKDSGDKQNIEIGAGTNTVTVRDCYMTRSDTNGRMVHVDNLRAEGSIIVDRCILEGITASATSGSNAFAFDESDSGSYNAEVNSCLVLTGFYGVTTQAGSTAVRQSVIANVIERGFYNSSGTGEDSDSDIRNCIFKNNGTANIWRFTSSAGDFVSDYNCYADGSFYNSATLDFSGWQSAGFDANGISSDPSFRRSDDYRLNGDSPCIGAGVEWWGSEPPQGQDGKRFCVPPSMGAYEYYGGGRAGAIPARVKPAGVDIAKARAA